MADLEPGPQVNVVFGDVFESSASILIVPCSTTGSMGGSFRNGIKALGITEIPGPLRAGQVAAIPVAPGRSSVRTVLVAAVVDPREKSPEAAIRRVTEATRRAGEVASAEGSVVASPRAAKRFIMAYNIAFASRLLYPEQIPAETLALWTLIVVRWPALAEWIREELPDGSLKPIDLEHHPSKLLVAPQVQRVITSKNGGPLDRDMFLRCCGYPVPATRTPGAPPREAGDRPDPPGPGGHKAG